MAGPVQRLRFGSLRLQLSQGSPSRQDNNTLLRTRGGMFTEGEEGIINSSEDMVSRPGAGGTREIELSVPNLDWRWG